MEIKEYESFGKILDVELLFESDVKPMKKINEKHKFQLQEKKLDYDDKISLAMCNLRNDNNFVEIKSTTKIVRTYHNQYITIYWSGTKLQKIHQIHQIHQKHQIHQIHQKHQKHQNESALDYYLKNNYVDMIKINDSNDLIIFIDETKKPNNRKIKFYKNIDDFEQLREQLREQFRTYHILDMNSFGILIEEIA